MGSNTQSPEPLVYFSFMHLFIHVCWSPQKGALLHRYGEKHKVTVHVAPRRRKAYIQWGAAWFPKEIIRTLLSLPQCHAAFGAIPSTLASVDQSLITACVVATPFRVYPSQLLPPPTWPRVEQSANLRYSEIWTRGWIYGRLATGEQKPYELHCQGKQEAVVIL
jgi:hypothetical protein